MTKIINKRDGIDPAKISGPYSLLAVMLLVAEILFAIWFYKAQSSIERSVAGSIIAVVFISLMLSVLRMNRTSGEVKSKKFHSSRVNSRKEIFRIALVILSLPASKFNE